MSDETWTGSQAPLTPYNSHVSHLTLDAWLREGRRTILAVPSAVVPEERNYLINPVHPGAGRIAVVRARQFTFHQRLRR